MFRPVRLKRSAVKSWEHIVREYAHLRYIRKQSADLMRALRKRRRDAVPKDQNQLDLEQAIFRNVPWQPLGCTCKEARDWLQAQFSLGMGWHNAGKWHVGFVVPPCAFPTADTLQAYHYQNLTPVRGKFKPIYMAPAARDGVARPKRTQLLSMLPDRTQKKKKRRTKRKTTDRSTPFLS